MERNLREENAFAIPRDAMAALVAYDPRHGACIWPSLNGFFPTQASPSLGIAELSSTGLSHVIYQVRSEAKLRQRTGLRLGHTFLKVHCPLTIECLGTSLSSAGPGWAS